ncbi:EpsG family protein [Fusobacterium sp. PH5-44]|uniref:EpsG family protein n=1 Tax=unclassified Fusobacterium TaxID=2648384 RepID=UPI003D1B2D95
MLIYNVIFLFLVIFPVLFKKKYRNFVCFFILFIFMSLRFNVGWDYRWYYPLGEKIEFLKYSIFINKSESLSIMNGQFDKYLWNYARLEFLNKILYNIVWYMKKPQLIIILYSFFSLFFLKKGLNNLNKKGTVVYAWIFFFCFPLFFFKYVSIMRQAVAVSIVFYSYKFIIGRSLKKFLFCIFIASLFHSSAKYMLVIYLFNYINLNQIILVIMFIFSFFSKSIILFLVERISLFNKYHLYMSGAHRGGGEKIYYIIILIGIFIILFWNKLVSIDFKNKKIIEIFFTGCCLYIGLNGVGHMGMRSSIYLLIFLLYLIPDIFKISKNKGKLLKISFGMVMLFLLNINLYLDKSNNGRTEFVPYRAFFINPNTLDDWEP